MNYPALRDALRAADGKVIISADTLTPNIATLLTDCYQGGPIIITGAAPGPDDGQNETVVVTGRSSFLNVADLPVELRANVDASGNAQITLRYTLTGENPGTDAWKFSKSFPNLPKMVDWSRPGTDPLTLPLDNLVIANAAFVVVSQPAANFQTGINFVGNLRPTGIVSIIESIFGQPQPIVLSGTVKLPKLVEAVTPLKPMEFPWDLEAPAPGITLQGLLGPDLTIAKMTFGSVAFRHYTPLTQEWLDKNPTYEPVLAYSGELRIPSAGIQVDAVAPYELGGNELFLIGRFEGLSLGNLANLLDIAGTGNLMDRLPDEIQKLGSAIGKLELTHAAIDLSLSQAKGFRVGMTSFAIGMPELKWQVWDDHFVIDSIICNVNVFDPFSKPRFEITITGGLEIEGVPVNVSASNRDNFTVYAELAEKQTIPLKQLISTYAPSLPAPSDLTINALRLTVAPFKEYSFGLAMAAEPNPWILDLGFDKLKVSNVVLGITYPKGGPLAGTFGGDVTFFDWATLTLRYDIPGDVLIRGVIPSLTLSSVISKLVNQPVTMPGGFDLTFENTYALVQKAGANYAFRMGTELKDVGIFALELRKTTGTQWGFAAGVNVTNGITSLSKVLEPLAEFEKLFSLQKLLLVISTFDDTTFTFPDLAAFNAPQIAGGRLTLPGKGGVIAGFNFFGQWQINTHDKQQNLLKELLGLDPTLGITLQVGADPSKEARLYVSYDTTIQGLPLSCKFGGQMSAGSVGLFLEGDMTVKIQKQPQTFAVKLDFVENGAFVAATMKGHTPVTISFEDVEVCKIGNLALAIGCDWEGIPSVGVAGQLEALGIESSLAVFFDSVEPQKSMVAGALSDLSLKDVLDTLTGNVLPSDIDKLLDLIAVKGTRKFAIPGSLADALDNMQIDLVAEAFAKQGVEIPTSLDQVFFVVAEPGESWFLTDQKNKMRHYQLKKDGDQINVSLEAQLYLVPQRTQIGSLPPCDPDFYLNGAISLFGFNAEATVDINPNQGIAVDAQMDKIVIYSEKFFSIKAAQGDGGPRISVSTFTQPDQPDPKLRDPHIYINGELNVLGLTRMTYAFLTTSGIEFDLKGQVLPLLYLDAHGRFKGLTDFGFGGAVKVGLDTIDLGPLGKININTGVEGSLDISFDGSKVSAKLAGGFKFAGKSFSVSLDLDVSTTDLTNLAKLVWDEVVRLVKQFLTDAAKWAEAVYKGFIQGVADVVAILQKEFGLALEKAKEIADEAWKLAQQACAVTEAALHM